MAKEGGKAFRKVKKGGRPSKLTQELIDTVCANLRHGAYVETAAAAAGVSKEILYKWMRAGNEKPKSIFGRFLHAVQVAQAEGHVNDLAAITAARAKNWQAAAWRAARRYPEQWAPTHRPPVASASPGANDNMFTLNYNLDKDDDEPKANEPGAD
jgi:hypothetical protein